MLIVIDNLLDPFLIPSTTEKQGCTLMDPYSTEDDLLDALWSIAAFHFDLSQVKVVERWSHNEKSINTLKWHVDEDVAYKLEMGISRLPQCTMLYYPEVADDLIGGWLCTKTEKIKPVSNRAVIFDSSIAHTVEPSIGIRRSIIYNPWNHEIKQYGPIA